MGWSHAQQRLVHLVPREHCTTPFRLLLLPHTSPDVRVYDICISHRRRRVVCHFHRSHPRLLHETTQERRGKLVASWRGQNKSSTQCMARNRKRPRNIITVANEDNCPPLNLAKQFLSSEQIR